MQQWANVDHTLVILGVDGEFDLELLEDELRARGIICEHFAEPDLNNQKTALAVHPSANGNLFKKLPLL